MLSQAAGFICFVAIDRPTGKMQFERLSKYVKHENRIAVVIFHLLGGFAIDGSDEHCVLEDGVEELGEGFLEVGEGEFFKEACKGDGVRNAPLGGFVSIGSVPKSEERAQFGQVIFCPSLQFGGIGTIREQSEDGDGEQDMEGMGLSLSGARIGNFFEALGEKFEERD